MKCKKLFSENNKRNISICGLQKILLRVLSIIEKADVATESKDPGSHI